MTSRTENIALILIAAAVPGEDSPRLRAVAEVAMTSSCDPVIIVLGLDVEAHQASLDGLDVVVVENAEWQSGLSSSIQAGVNGAMILGCDGAILALALESPTPAEAAKLIALYRDAGIPIVTSDSDFCPSPTLFSREVFPKLLAVSGDRDWTLVR